MRDHSLEERLVVNHSHTQFKGRAVLLDSLEGGLRALAMGKHGGALAPVPAWASFAACSALPGGAYEYVFRASMVVCIGYRKGVCDGTLWPSKGVV